MKLATREEAPIEPEVMPDIPDRPPPEFVWNRPQRSGQFINLIIGLGAIISALMGLERLLTQ
jgi:hypothetical protein